MNKDIYIIGGGSSLKGFDFERLRDKASIAVNMAALDVPDPTYCLTADSSIFRKLQDGIFSKVDTSWVVIINGNHCTMQKQDGRIVHKNSGYVYDLLCPTMTIRDSGHSGLGFTFKDFKTGYNSGFCAFQLAVLLGYERIHLLGIDLYDGLHYHNRYGAGKISNPDLKRYVDCFKQALEILQAETKVEVFSYSANSPLSSHIPIIPLTSL